MLLLSHLLSVCIPVRAGHNVVKNAPKYVWKIETPLLNVEVMDVCSFGTNSLFHLFGHHSRSLLINFSDRTFLQLNVIVIIALLVLLEASKCYLLVPK